SSPCSVVAAEDRFCALRIGHAVEPRKDVARLGLRDAPKRRLDSSQQIAHPRTRPACANLQLTPGDLGFQISDRDRQHWICHLDDSKTRRELGERRKLAGLD